MTTSIIYKGYGGNLNKEHDPLDLKDEAILARNAAQAPYAAKQANNSIQHKRQLAQRQQRAIYG